MTRPLRHQTTDAALTTTSETAKPAKNPPRTPAQVQAQQQADADRGRQEKQAQQTANLQKAGALPATVPAPAAPVPISAEARERHLADWGGTAGRLIAFNGSSGIHRTLDDDVEVPAGRKFIAVLDQCQRGYVKFNEGAPPTLAMVRLGEDTDIPAREELGDNDPAEWPINQLSGQPDDPWKLQIIFPLIGCDDDSGIFGYVARGPVALNAAGDLLGRFRYSHKRHRGLVPVIELGSGTYQSKKFGPRPKPILKIVDWVNPDGSPAPSPAPSPGKLPAKGAAAPTSTTSCQAISSNKRGGGAQVGCVPPPGGARPCAMFARYQTLAAEAPPVSCSSTTTRRAAADNRLSLLPRAGEKGAAYTTVSANCMTMRGAAARKLWRPCQRSSSTST
jgi:hypothetical protein